MTRTSADDQPLVDRQSFDVVVVGAGPAGASAACYAARQGVRVCLLERSMEIGYPIRTSGASFTAKLTELGIPERLYHPVRRLRLIGPTRSVTFEYEVPVACVLDVRGLYQHLAMEAATAGTEIRLNREVTAVTRSPGRVWEVAARNSGAQECYSAPIVIDASGFARVAQKKAGLQGPVTRFGFGIEYEMFAPAWPEDEAVLAMGSKIAPSGYGWVFPRGNRRARAGVGVIRPDTDARPHDYFTALTAIPSIAIGLNGAQPIEAHVGYIPSEPVSSRFVYEGLLAAGDAAGHASPLVGEGIRYAIRAGRIAGDVAGRSARARDYSARALERFQRTWEAEEQRSMEIAYAINLRLARYTDQMWDERITLLEKLPPDLFLQALMTNFTIGWASRVLAHAPRLFGPVIRSLITRRR